MRRTPLRLRHDNTFRQAQETDRRARRAFERAHQKELGLVKIPKSAPRLAREIAQSEPWRGEESIKDATTRVLVDHHKPLRVSRTQRLMNARQGAIDYKYSEEGSTFKERLKTSRSPGSGTSGGGIESIANQSIEDAIARGQFEDLPRGAPLKVGYELANPCLDTTEYILNNMIKKQGATPPWVEKQKNMWHEIKLFRESLRSSLCTRLVHRYVDKYPRLSTEALINECLSLNHRDLDWEHTNSERHEHAVRNLNSTIRGYNIQAPPAARKGYIQLQQELDTCYNNMNEFLPMALRKFKGDVVLPEAPATLHISLPPLEAPEKHYGLKQLFQELFKRA